MNASAFRTLWRIAVLIVAGALLVTGLTLAARLSVFGGPGSGPSAEDARLRDIAADITPTIKAIEQVRLDTGAYPATSDDLAKRLPVGVMADTVGETLSLDTGHGAVWVYLRQEDGQGYDLARHLPDGGSLEASNDHGSITWLYAETDDDDAEVVTLPP